MPTALSAQGTQLQVGDGQTPENFTTIARVMSIEGPGFQRDEIDVTSHDSQEWKETIAGLKDASDLKFTVTWNPADPTHDETTGLLAMFNDGATRNWRLVFPTNPVKRWQFSGWVKSLGAKEPVNGALTMDVDIRVSGAPNFAA